MPTPVSKDSIFSLIAMASLSWATVNEFKFMSGEYKGSSWGKARVGNSWIHLSLKREAAAHVAGAAGLAGNSCHKHAVAFAPVQCAGPSRWTPSSRQRLDRAGDPLRAGVQQVHSAEHRVNQDGHG